jgi:mannose-6-phosphate isomerase-like protein (cupin superfamily)
MAGIPGLVRRLISVAPPSRFEGTAGSGGELWFVIAGRGRLDSGGLRGVAVGPDTGVWIPPRLGYRLDADPDAPRLLLDAVALPAAARWAPGAPGAGPPGAAAVPRVSELRDCEVERTGDRRFRVLLGPGRGCEAATQFVGEIPPGRAPEHSHPYDELVLVLRGEGVAHVRGAARPLAPGTRLHLPPGRPHCLENTGPGTLVVLGVFHPGGSPAQKAAG